MRGRIIIQENVIDEQNKIICVWFNDEINSI